MPKAYELDEFIHGESARPLRILAEYLEPRERLAEHKISRAVTFWGSARIVSGDKSIADGRDYYNMAFELASKLAQWTQEQHPIGERYHILTGGGPGIMEAAHAGAAKVNPMFNVGFNISLPFEQSANPYIPEQQLFDFHYFFTRKFWFLQMSAALVVFPGGFGTLDELFELLTPIQTGKAKKRPIVLFGSSYWHEVVNLPALARQGLISTEDLSLIKHVDGVDQAMTYLTAEL